MKHLPERTCMGCNKKTSKNKLIRVVEYKNEIFIDKSGNLDGRGAYICNNVFCLEKVIKSKRLERVLKTKIGDDIYEGLRGVVIE